MKAITFLRVPARQCLHSNWRGITFAIASVPERVAWEMIYLVWLLCRERVFGFQLFRWLEPAPWCSGAFTIGLWVNSWRGLLSAPCGVWCYPLGRQSFRASWVVVSDLIWGIMKHDRRTNVSEVCISWLVVYISWLVVGWIARVPGAWYSLRRCLFWWICV